MHDGAGKLREAFTDPAAVDQDPRPGSILIVEDDADHREALAFILRSEGYHVRAAADGEAALTEALHDVPDLVVLDVDLPPGIDGFATCRRLHELCSPAPSVLFLSAHTSSSHAVRGLDLGGLDYIGKPYDEEQLTARVRAAIRTRREIEMLRNRVAHDPLTGLLSRGELDERARSLIALGKRYRRPFGFLMVDIDHFKSINDRFGHPCGDLVLEHVAHRIVAACREADSVIRYGGEEFAILAPDTDLSESLKLAERLRDEVQRDRVSFDLEDGTRVQEPVTVSIGVTAWSPGDRLEQLIRRADGALYAAKHAGRNRVRVHASRSRQAGA